MVKRTHGFTLIEIMFAVAIIGILSAVAIPAFTGYLKKAHRSDAQGALASFANAMERHYVSKNTFTGAGTLASDNGVANSAGPPTIFATEAPLDSSTKYYDLTIEKDVTATSYTLRATPKISQSSDGYLELTSTGIQRWDRNNDGTIDANENCWDSGGC